MATGLSGKAYINDKEIGTIMGYNGPPPKAEMKPESKVVGHVPPVSPVTEPATPPADSYTYERYEHKTDGHFKFWEVWYPAAWAITGRWRARWGRIGTTGQTKTWEEGTAYQAMAMAQVCIDQKLAKGYVKVGGVLEVGQDTAAPSEAWQAKQKQQSTVTVYKPITESAKLTKLTDSQRSAVISLHQSGMDAATIASTLHVRRQQVEAVVAHVTMGMYGGQQAAPAGEVAGKRKFDWSE